MHEFEEFVDHSLEEFPVSFQKPRILSDNVHYVGRNNGLVIFAANHFSEAK
jgi:hypothetical protein